LARPLPLSARQFVGFFSSTSYASAYLRTLADPDAYLEELESRFQQAHPDDMIPVDFRVELTLARET